MPYLVMLFTNTTWVIDHMESTQCVCYTHTYTHKQALILLLVHIYTIENVLGDTRQVY